MAVFLYAVVATNNGTVTINGSTATYEPTQDLMELIHLPIG